MHSVSIVGCGYTGLRLAQRWLRLRHSVQGFGTRDDSLRHIAGAGASPARMDLDHTERASLDVEGQLVYYLVPPAAAGEHDVRLERLLLRLFGMPRRVVYMSTTGVYGNRHGGWVDEETRPAPESARAVRRLAAENTLREWADARGVSWCVLRVPGIYGPGRLPLERLRRAEPAIDPREAMPGNRIHVEDLVTACVAAGRSPQADCRVVNVTDGSDESLTAFLERVAHISQLPPPPLISRSDAEAASSQASWSFLRESRRVSNRRLLDELAVTLAYGDLDAGIRASL